MKQIIETETEQISQTPIANAKEWETPREELEGNAEYIHLEALLSDLGLQL